MIVTRPLTHWTILVELFWSFTIKIGIKCTQACWRVKWVNIYCLARHDCLANVSSSYISGSVVNVISLFVFVYTTMG